MESQAYFSGIREKIIEHLGAATNSLLVAVAWLTDREIFDGLVACQWRGLTVTLAMLDARISSWPPVGVTPLLSSRQGLFQ